MQEQIASALSSAQKTTGGDRSQLLPLKIAAEQLLAADVPAEQIAARIEELAAEGYQLPDIAAALKTLRQRDRGKAPKKRTTAERITIAGRILLLGLVVCLVGVAIATRSDRTSSSTISENSPTLATDTRNTRTAARESSPTSSQKSSSSGKIGPRSATLFAEDFGAAWPFTVDVVILRRYNIAAGDAVVVESTGVKYALNGTALTMFPPVDPIWRDNPDLPGTKISIADLIQRGLTLGK